MSTGGSRTARKLAKASDNSDETESVDKLSGISGPEENQPNQSESGTSGEQGQSKQAAEGDQQQNQSGKSAEEDQQQDSSKQSAGQSVKQTMPSGQQQDSAAAAPAEMEPQLEQLIREFIPRLNTLQLAQLSGQDCSDAKAAVLNWVHKVLVLPIPVLGGFLPEARG